MLHDPIWVDLLKALDEFFNFFRIIFAVLAILHLDRSPGEVDDVTDRVGKIFLFAKSLILNILKPTKKSILK